VHDITVSNETRERRTRTIGPDKFPARAAGHAQDDDELLARVLIASWTLATGRTLRADIPARFLSADELIDFWADDQMAEGPAALAGLAPHGGNR